MSFLYNPLLVAPSQLFQVIRKSQVNIEERRGIYLGEKEGGGWGNRAEHTILPRKESV